MTEVTMIASVGRNGVIGNEGKLAWRNKTDMGHFVARTTNHAVIMGRKTYQSIPEKFRPFSNRYNVVLTRNADFKEYGVQTASCLDEALEHVKHYNQAFIAGGGEIYHLAFPIADKLLLTEVDRDLEGDTFFPIYDNWMKINTVPYKDFNIVTYIK